MEIRQATVWDARDITKLWVKFMKETQPVNRKFGIKEQEVFYLQLLVNIKKDFHCVVVAVDKEKIIGFITAYVHYYRMAGNLRIGTCNNLYVEKKYRGQDVAGQLLSWATNYGKSYKIKEMEFVTNYEPRLIKIWGRKGYKPSQVTFIKEV
jgi:GNAT superfamily N-acetyltransferase